jgi:hypothetical protein
MILYHRNIGAGVRSSLRDLDWTLNCVNEEILDENAYMEGYLESKRRDTAGMRAQHVLVEKLQKHCRDLAPED